MHIVIERLKAYSITKDHQYKTLCPPSPSISSTPCCPPHRAIPLPKHSIAPFHYPTVRELTSLLGQLNGSNNNANNNYVANNNNAGRSMLAAVLLRRDISTLAGAETMTGLPPSASMALMGEVAEPLMALFTKQQQQQQQTRRQIGHCIAELCGSLSVVSGEHGREWMTSVLGRLEPGVSDDVHQLLYEDFSMSTA